MKKDYKVYDNVEIGKNATIGDYVVIGKPPRGRESGELKTIIGDNATIRSHSVIYSGNRIGNNLQTGHDIMIRECNNVGDNVSIGTKSVIEHHVEVESEVRIHSQAFVPEESRLRKKCWLGPNVVVTNAYHPLCPKAKQCLKGADVGERAKIGGNATLLPDIKIGSMALVGAGAVVIDDVDAYTVVAGNPAEYVKDVEDLECPYGLINKPYEVKKNR